MDQKDNELDVLHSGIMALEELLIQKGIITLDELNLIIRKSYKECKEKRENGQIPKVEE